LSSYFSKWKRPRPGVGTAHGQRGDWEIRGKGRNWDVFLNNQPQQKGLDTKREAKEWAERHDTDTVDDEDEKPRSASDKRNNLYHGRPVADEDLIRILQGLSLTLEYLTQAVWMLCKHFGVEGSQHEKEVGKR
jgi:hypothetical protein